MSALLKGCTLASIVWTIMTGFGGHRVSGESNIGSSTAPPVPMAFSGNSLMERILQQISGGKQVRVDWDHFSFSQDRECDTCPKLRGDALVLKNLGKTVVSVPCGYGGTVIPNALLGIPKANDGKPYTIHQKVVDSSSADNTTGYVTVNPVTGAISTSSAITPPHDVTQTIMFTLQHGPEFTTSSVNITFVFQSCNLQLTCPPGPVFVCNNPTANQQFSQLTCSVLNPPAGVTIDCDRPSDAVPLNGNGGALIADINRFTASVQVPVLFAPAVVLDTTTDDAGVPLPPDPAYNPLFVLNYNLVTPQAPPNGVCVYGTNNGNAVFMQQGCQYLRFSAEPSAASVSPYLPGYQIVQVCYNSSAC